MTPRELFDLALNAVRDGDADALRSLYEPGAVRIGSLRDHVGRPLTETTLESQGDLVRFVIADRDERLLGTWVLRDGLIWRETLAAATVPAAAAPRAAVTIDLEPYTAWELRPVPDPRTAGRDALMPALMEIVEVEGPILAGRAFNLYTRASGGKKTTSAAKAPLAGSAWRLKIAERLAIGRADATTIADDDVLRVAGTDPVRVRELGPRTLEEVPLNEVAALMRRLRESDPARPATDLKRAVLDAYGLIRMTARAEQYLDQALAQTSGSA
jgi:hypothetical protein